MEKSYKFHTPLMWKDKSDIWKMAKQIGGKDYLNFIIKNTHTCYKGDRKTFNEWGYGCNKCPACLLRSKGWKKFVKMIEANKIYSVKEIFLTLQGEGYNTGTPAVFCRFSGCNLWNGIEKDRKKAVCSFCDTDFNGVNGINGGKYKLGDLVKIINSLWPKKEKNKFVVFTGGELTLQ